MKEMSHNSDIAIIGGGRVCKEILKIALSDIFANKMISIVGVADINNKAVGLLYAKNKGIYTTNNYTDLFQIKTVNLIIELTGDNDVLAEIKKLKPGHIALIDHFEAMSVWDYLQIEEKLIEIKKDLRKNINVPRKIEKSFNLFSRELTKIVEERTHHLQKIEKELTEKVGALYKVLFDTDPNPIFFIDSKTLKILKVNRRTQEYYQYSEEELLSMSFLELGDNKDDEIMRGLQNLPEDQCAFFSKKRHYKKNHHHFYVNINVCNSKYDGSNAFIATTTDISKSIEKEMQLIQASKMTTLGTMAAGIAHELNQPLNVIQVGADFFLKKIRKGQPITEDELHIVASEINGNVQRAAEIINQLRSFARQPHVAGVKLNINAPIRDVTKILGQQLRVHQIELELKLGNDLPFIIADHNRMLQVFINFVANAMDALDEKGNRLGKKSWKRKLEIKTFLEDGRVKITISDNGIGLPGGIKDKIFEPFFTTKNVGKGTGLGTSISYSIVNEFGGTIDFTSEVNKGTVFELSFPACAPHEP